MCQAILSPNLTKKFQWKVSQIADNRFPCVMLLGGLSINLNHLKTGTKINWLNYQSLLKAIPPLWINMLKFQRTSSAKITSAIANYQENPRLASHIYQTLISYDDHVMRYYNRWCATGLTVDYEFYLKCFSKYHQISRVTKLRDFQYCLLLQKIPTNTDLFA